jgi:hypothetical protein
MLLANSSGTYNADYTSLTYETNYRAQETGTVQCYIAGTATVAVQMRSQSDAPWLTVHSFTASGAQELRLMPEMQVVASSVSGGDAKVWLVER